MEKPWAKDIFELEKHYRTSIKDGLLFSRSREYLKKYGPNAFRSEQAASSWQILWRQCTNIFVLILLIASIIALYSEGLNQAVVLWVIIIINISLGYAQENKAEKTLAALKESISTKSKVIRQSTDHLINTSEIVPGDLVVLEQGDQVPADLRLVEAHRLQINQAVLTGESTPAAKITYKLPEDLSILEADNLAFSGTSVVAGRGLGLVIATGENCQFGKIVELIDKKHSVTPLEKRLNYLSKLLTAVSIVLAISLFFLGLWRGWPTLEILTYSLAILVAAVPESLPTTITLSLAMGVIQMAKRKAVVRRLSSVETLGLVSIIATDKTGTLTKNELSLAEVVLRLPNGEWQRFSLGDGQILSDQEERKVKRFLEQTVLCTDVRLHGKDYSGDPTEVAIAKTGQLYGLRIELIKERNRRLSEIPFDSSRGYMATLHSAAGEKFIIVKGGFEKVIKFCKPDTDSKLHLGKEAKALAASGMRVLAVATKKISALEESSLHGLAMLGLLGMIDLPSDSASASILESTEAGVNPVIITGDNELTAAYVGRAVGMDVRSDQIALGREIEDYSRKDLRSAVKNIKIFARVSPEHKIRIVEAIKKSGAVVAVTGDGVNDAPALKAADVGVAMGNGTAVAREASDIILLDNNYGTIVEAIRFGRAIYENIGKSIVFLLSGNFAELFVIAFAFIVNLPVPITAIQVLWMNLVTDALPAIAFAFEPPDQNIMKEGPKDNRRRVVNKLIYHAVVLVAIALPVVILSYLFYLKSRPEVMGTVILTLMIFIEMAFAASVHTKDPIWENPFATFSNRYLWLAIASSVFLQILFIETPLRNILGLKDLILTDYLFVLVGALIVFISSEFVKLIFSHKHSGKN